ncbi:sporulation protein [Micromonospora sp. STR1_7]|uniref:Sporulation protein n=1 Tax=Micromonospora parastrephiae TaxID=2806101 RepID=A0ABS1XYS7_9ACTN|nr:sporulation protein [Micromonospora parastrephiae]MBM0234409.1 sporulation protein [Micromonospora parastrephiae]
MVFKRLMKAMGVGGPSVETVLADPNCRPGGQLEGRIQVLGGDHQVDIDHVTLGLVTRVEVESGDNDYDTTQEFHRQQVTGAFQLEPGQRYDIPFRFAVPWETPVTELYGQHLHGMTMGLRTELEVARAVDKGDLDAVSVHPLPAQERLLDALLRLGFRFARADVERGHIYGVRQTLPFYQEIEFSAAPRYARSMNQLEVTFIADERQMQVVLEVDKRGGVFTEGRDAFGRFTVDHATADRTDWTTELDNWLRQSLTRRGLFS